MSKTFSFAKMIPQELLHTIAARARNDASPIPANSMNNPRLLHAYLANQVRGTVAMNTTRRTMYAQSDTDDIRVGLSGWDMILSGAEG